MKALVTNRRVMTWLCACPVDETAPRWTKPACVLFTSLLFAMLISGAAVSVAFVVRNFSTDLEGCLYALYQIVGFFSIVYMLAILQFVPTKIASIFDTLTSIYDAYAQEESFKYLVRTNNRSELVWKLYFILVVGGFPASTMSMAATSVLICRVFIGGFDTKYIFHPYEMIFPWNQQTAIGYACEIVFSFISGDAYFITNGALLLLFISMCWTHEAFYKMFVHLTRELDHFDNNRNDAEHLAKLIRFHVETKGWFSDTAKVYSLFILVQLICSMIFLASAIFQLDLNSGEIDFRMSVLLMCVMVSGSNLFCYCFFGKMATDSYLQMSDRLYEANWLALPVHLQKYFILMISNAQRPRFYHGFGIAVLNLETFCQMLKTVITYYMMFKTVTSD